MIATNVKRFVGIPLAAGALAALMGFVLAAASSQKAEVTPAKAAAAPARDQPRGKAKEPTIAARLSAAGTVVDEDGRPVPGRGSSSANGRSIGCGKSRTKKSKSSFKARNCLTS